MLNSFNLEKENKSVGGHTERIKKHKSRTTLNSAKQSPVDENKSPYNDYSSVKRVLDFDRAEYQRRNAPQKSRILSLVEDFSANTTAIRESAFVRGFGVENTESSVNEGYDATKPLQKNNNFINRQSQSMIECLGVNRSNTMAYNETNNRFKFKVIEKPKMYREIRPVKANPFTSF